MPLHEVPANHCTCAAVAGALVLAFTLATFAAARAGVDTKATQLLSKGIGFRFTTMHWAPGATGTLHVAVPEHQFSVWMFGGIRVVKLPFPRSVEGILENRGGGHSGCAVASPQKRVERMRRSEGVEEGIFLRRRATTVYCQCRS